DFILARFRPPRAARRVTASQPHPALGLHLKARQLARRNVRDWDAQAEGVAQRYFKPSRQTRRVVMLRGRLDLNSELREGVVDTDFHAIFSDTVRGPQDVLDRAGIYVDAAHHHHVISSSQDSALQGKVVAAALAARVLRPLDQ